MPRSLLVLQELRDRACRVRCSNRRNMIAASNSNVSSELNNRSSEHVLANQRLISRDKCIGALARHQDRESISILLAILNDNCASVRDWEGHLGQVVVNWVALIFADLGHGVDFVELCRVCTKICIESFDLVQGQSRSGVLCDG